MSEVLPRELGKKVGTRYGRETRETPPTRAAQYRSQTGRGIKNEPSDLGRGEAVEFRARLVE